MNYEISKLIEEIISEHNADSISKEFVSMYLKFDPGDQDSFITQIHSLTHKIVEQINEKLSESQKQQIQNTLVEQIDTIKTHFGLAVFFRLDTNKPKEMISNTTIINLKFEPKTEVTVGNLYDFLQLSNTANNSDKLSVVHIQRSSTNIYNYESDRLELVKEIENETIYKDSQSPQKVHSPTKSDSVSYSSGSGKIEMSDKEADKEFLYSTVDDINKNIELNKKTVVVLSHNFHDYEDKIKTKFQNKTDIEFIRKNPSSKEEIIQILSQTKKPKKSPKLDEIKENPQYAIGIKDALKAIRSSKSKRVFLPYDFEKEGYIIIQDSIAYVYPYGIRDSFFTEELPLWICLSSIQLNSEFNLWEEEDIAVLKRF